MSTIQEIRDRLTQDVAREFGPERSTADASQIQAAAESIQLLEQLWPAAWHALDTDDLTANEAVDDAR